MFPTGDKHSVYFIVYATSTEKDAVSFVTYFISSFALHPSTVF